MSLPDPAISVHTRPFSSLPASTAPEYPAYLAHHVTAAFELVRSSASWKHCKTYTSSDGGVVSTKTAPSRMQGRAAKLAWHLRQSVHKTAETELDYEAFRNGLLVDHQPNEIKYIHDIIDIKLVEAVRKDQAEVWRTSYQMPPTIGNRDFLQLQLLLDLPRHVEPFSSAHQEVAANQILHPSSSTETEAENEETGHRSFLVIQLPITHEDEPERKGEFVRGVYGSVEVVREMPEGVEWT
ncbi:hypothetical protein ACQY0O_001221 [Thecaphora frezii]